jgi:hypothetical protein
MRINQGIQDGDIVFRGNDGGSIITALTIDMSAAGAATFNSNVTATGFSAASGGALVARVGRSLTGNDLANVNFYDADAATFPGHVHVVANSSQADDSYQSGEIRFWHFNGSAYNSIAAFNKHGGLAFGTDQAAANTLDDYEEGAFSYDIFGITATTKTFRGIYTKIGDLVSIQGLVIISGKTGGSGNPYLPLPFVPDNTNIGTSYLGAIPQVNTVSSDIVYFGLYGNAAQLYGNNLSAGYIGHGSWGNGLIGLNFTYSV